MEPLSACLPFWRDLSPQEGAFLEQAARPRLIPKGTQLHSGLEDCTGLFLVTQGRLRAYLMTGEGKEITLYRLSVGDMCLFSAPCILNSIQFDVFITAEQETAAWYLPAGLYKELMGSSTLVANYTNELMASRFSQVMWLMDQILSKKLDARLAALLLEEWALAGSDTLHLTHEQLARHLGSAREVVTRMLKYFQSEGLVQLTRGSIALLDLPRLRILAEGSVRGSL